MLGELLLMRVHQRTMPGAVHFPQPRLLSSSVQLFSLLPGCRCPRFRVLPELREM